MKNLLKKHYLLKLALERVNYKLSKYENNLHNNDFQAWSQLHALKCRLESRLKDHYNEFLRWNFYDQYMSKANK